MSISAPSRRVPPASETVAGVISLARLRRAVQTPRWSYLVVEGDSLNTINTWSQFVSVNGMAVINVAAGGDTLANMVGEYDSQVAPHEPNTTRKRAAFSLRSGINDITNDLASAETIIGYLTTLWGRARAGGFDVIAWTIGRCSFFEFTGTLDVWNTVNAWIRDHPELYDYLVEPDTYFPDALNFTDFVLEYAPRFVTDDNPDGEYTVHNTADGQRRLWGDMQTGGLCSLGIINDAGSGSLTGDISGTYGINSDTQTAIDGVSGGGGGGDPITNVTIGTTSYDVYPDGSYGFAGLLVGVVNPELLLVRSYNDPDNRAWDIVCADPQELWFRAVSDDGSVDTKYLRILRSGTDIVSATFVSEVIAPTFTGNVNLAGGWISGNNATTYADDVAAIMDGRMSGDEYTDTSGFKKVVP